MDNSKCETCMKDCPQAQGRHETATDRMYAMGELVKCAPYWGTLFDENEQPKITPDRLRELVEADRDGRILKLPFKPPKTVCSCHRFWPDPIKSYYPGEMEVLRDMLRGYVFGDTPEAARDALKEGKDELH